MNIDDLIKICNIIEVSQDFLEMQNSIFWYKHYREEEAMLPDEAYQAVFSLRSRFPFVEERFEADDEVEDRGR